MDGAGEDDCTDAEFFSVSAGDLDVVSEKDTGTPTTYNAAYGVVFRATNAGEFIIPAVNDNDTHRTAIEYSQFNGADTTHGSTEALRATLVNTMSIVNMYVDLNTQPGTTDASLSFMLRQNVASNTDFEVVITGANNQNSDSTGSLTLSDDDLIGMRITPANTPAVSIGSTWSLTATVP
jgi:hypothetical protein